MATTSERDLARIAKVLSDPRYWNKAHPEHPRVFADSQRLFRDAYPEPPQGSHAALGTVHVRTYKRTQDGKQVDVSAYDRVQKIGFRLPLSPELFGSAAIEDISNNVLHDWVQAAAIATVRDYGGLAEGDVRVIARKTKLESIPDVIAVLRNGRILVIEVKTGLEPKWTENQPSVYSLMREGYEVFSNDPKIEKLGFRKGEFLPPCELYVAYLSNPNGSVQITPLEDYPFAPGKRLDKGYKGR